MANLNSRLVRTLIILFTIIYLFLFVGFPVQNDQSAKVQHIAPIFTNNSLVNKFSESPQYTLKELLNCHEKPANFSVGQQGSFIVFYNFVKGSKSFDCHETVTYTAPADFTFFDNLPTLVQRWEGPVSIAVYAPGDDFNRTLSSIAYLRNCQEQKALIKEWVTFHVLIHEQHFPTEINERPLIESYSDTYNCKAGAPYTGVKIDETYRRLHNLTFPINVARNVARQTAQTHYVFAADIELYPNRHFIQDFLKMMNKHPEYIHGANPRVFVLPIFEIETTVPVPDNKTHLQRLYKAGKAILFHKRICSICHAIPNLTQWLDMSETNEFDVFTTAKRIGKYRMWEAFYVGTKADPLFDERLSWEGQSNKMPQGYAMCLLNYDYMVLNNAFIIHKPGIKKEKEQVIKFWQEISKSDELINRYIGPQLKHLYGERKGCVLYGSLAFWRRFVLGRFTANLFNKLFRNLL